VTATVASLLSEGADRFTQAGLDCARQDALRLLASVLGSDGLALYVEPRRPVDAEARTRFRALVERRAAHDAAAVSKAAAKDRGRRRYP